MPYVIVQENVETICPKYIQIAFILFLDLKKNWTPMHTSSNVYTRLTYSIIVYGVNYLV